jgi:hypothetical protein
MAYVMVRHSVRDYNEWRPSFDELESKREAIGCKTERIFRGATEPNEITVLLECDTLNDAEAYVKSDDLNEGMKRRGIMGRPDVSYLEEADTPSMQ